jgi:hypothetical protein
MKRVLDTIRFIFISPEVIVLLLVFGCYEANADWLKFLGEKLNSNTEIMTVLLLSPVAALAWAFNESKAVLFPKEENKTLLGWKGYWMLRNRVLYSLFIIVICLVIGIIVLLVRSDLATLSLGAVVVAMLGILGSVLICMSLASLSVRQILEEDPLSE